MIYKIFSVFDRAAQSFGRPVFALAVPPAVRSFDDEVRDPRPDNVMNKHPGDFELFHLGEFDDATGLFVLFAKPTCIRLGSEVVIS